MTLKFLPEGQVPESPGDLIAREAWVGRLAAAVLLLSLGCAVPVLLGALLLDQGVGGWRLELSFDSLFGLAYYGITGVIALVVLIVCLFGGFAFLSSALAAMKPGTWVVRASEDGLYIKLRHFADRRLPKDDPIVAFIPRRDVRWLRGHDQMARHVGRTGDFKSTEDDTLAKQAYLEIKVDGDDLAEVTERLEQERDLWSPTMIRGVRQKAKGAAVSVRPGGVLRIDWRTKGTRLRPRLKDALAALSPGYRLAAEIESEQAQAKNLDHAAQEERLLDMLRQGNTVDAVVVARDLYGFSVTEAKQFLDELQNR